MSPSLRPPSKRVRGLRAPPPSALAGLAAALVGLTVACAAASPHEAAVPSPPFATLSADGPAPPQEHAWVIFGPDTVVAEVASTPQAREQGLMFREALPDGTGMLFVFADPAIRGFWMRNTYLDLDIAFLDADYRVIEIHQRDAMDEEVRDSTRPFTYALEVPRGWLAAHGVEVGDTARIEMRRPGGG